MAEVVPAWAMPTVVLGAGALAVLVAELAFPARLRQAVEVTCLTLAGLAIAGSVAAAVLVPTDGLARLVHLWVAVAAATAVVLSRSYLDEGEPAAFLALVLLAGAGMGLLGAARSWPQLFLGLELLSLSLYVLVAYRREDPASQEGAFKYFVLGSAASGLLLLGIALVFGATGSLELEAPAASLPQGPLAAAGFALVLVGLAFKLALAPFHFWAPDAYEGSLLGVAAFMSVATKAAAFVALVRAARLAPASALAVLGVLAVASMLVGSLGALRQRDFRRLMAYSGVANAGYLLAGLPASSAEGLAAGAFYLTAYAFTNLGLFAVAALVEAPAGPGTGPLRRVGVDQFDGLGARSPWAAWLATLFLAGLTGLPLTGGFVGKVLLVLAAVSGWAYGLAIALALSTAILAYPYWKLVQGMWRGGASATPAAWDGDRARAGAPPSRVWAVAAICAAVTVLLGLAPQRWLEAVAAVWSTGMAVTRLP